MKFLRYFFLILFALIWLIALSPVLSSKMTVADSYRFGDLYRLSNLSQFRDPVQQCIEYKVPPKASKSKIHLFVIGDSFTEPQRITGKDFVADNYTRVHWNEVLHLKLDTTEINILLIESVERHFREKFVSVPGNLVPDSSTFVAKAGDKKFMHKLDEAFDSKTTKARLDEVLFQNDLALGLKELKSNFNFDVFDRTNKEVTSVNNKQDLVYFMDTDEDTTQTTSSFSSLGNSEVDSMVNYVNQTQILASKMGFDEVILSIIPNKVSVLMPDYQTYNNLIERIYSHENLKVKYIDVYQDFRKMGKAAYLKGDSHWTCEGQYLWLDKTNALINTITTEKSL